MIQTNNAINHPVGYVQAERLFGSADEPYKSVVVLGPDYDLSVTQVASEPHSLEDDAQQRVTGAEEAHPLLRDVYIKGQAQRIPTQRNGIVDVAWVTAPGRANERMEQAGLMPGVDFLELRHNIQDGDPNATRLRGLQDGARALSVDGDTPYIQPGRSHYNSFMLHEMGSLLLPGHAVAEIKNQSGVLPEQGSKNFLADVNVLLFRTAQFGELHAGKVAAEGAELQDEIARAFSLGYPRFKKFLALDLPRRPKNKRATISDFMTGHFDERYRTLHGTDLPRS